MPKEKPVKFTSVLTRATFEYGGYYLPVPKTAAAKFEVKNGTRRVICTLNGKHTYQCAVLPNAKGFYIGTNKKIRDEVGITPGSKVAVELKKDESKYGMPMPAEFREVLKQDPEGNKLFHSLTPGKQRSILWFVGNVKDIDKRIQTALIFIEHLKRNDGKVVHDQLSDELKRPAL